MAKTPFFPAWRHQLAPQGSRIAKAFGQVGTYTLCQLENALASWVPADLFPKAPDKANSRDRTYTRWRTFWCLLWQNLNPQASGREVVRQLQALFGLSGGPQISPADGAYCRAKARLPVAQLAAALTATAKAAEAPLSPAGALQGRPLKAVDGTTVTLADTPKNRTAYPPVEPTPTPCLPWMRVVVLFSLLSGAILTVAHAHRKTSELSLLHSLLDQLRPRDILLGDRAFGCYPVLALLQSLGIDFIGRTARRIDGRRCTQRLGRNDWLLCWQKNKHRTSPWLSALQWAGLPATLSLRALKVSCYQKGFRVRQLVILTTLVDPQLYPAQEILQAYRRRWRLEMCLDDLKTTLHLETLRGRTPEMVHKELLMRLVAHNLIRCTMAEAATEHAVCLERLSFKGSLDAVRQFTQAMAQARSKRKRQALWQHLLKTVATDLVPERPGRREPRAVKRKKNKYPRLTTARHKFRDHPKRHTRQTNARLRKLGLR